MASRVIHVEPPLAGVEKSGSFQRQAPFSGPEITNFWPVDVRTGRAVLATRPPLVSYGAPASPVNLLAQLNLPAPTLFAAANGKLYKLTNVDAATWSLISSTEGVTAGRPVNATPFFKRFVVANTGDAVVYNDAGGTLKKLKDIVVAGAAPTDCRLAMTFAGAVWLAGDAANPHVFSCCRTGDVTDWDFGLTDEGAAFTSTGEFLGLITEPLTAMFAISDDSAILASEESIWQLTGHPRRGGRLELVLDSVGVLGQWAWTTTPDGRTYFMSRDGLMTIARSEFGRLLVQPVSRTKMPDELLGLPIDVFNPTVNVEHDTRWNMVFVAVRGEREQAWAHDLTNGGFFRMELAEYPTVVREFQPLVSADASGVVFAGESALRFNRAGSESIKSSALIGPVKISPHAAIAAMIDEAAVVFGGGSTSSTAKIKFYTGPTGHVSVLRATADAKSRKYEVKSNALQVNAGRCYPKLSGSAVTVAIDQPATTNRIVFDGVELIVSESGRSRDTGQIPPTVLVPTGEVKLST